MKYVSFYRFFLGVITLPLSNIRQVPLAPTAPLQALYIDSNENILMRNFRRRKEEAGLL